MNAAYERLVQHLEENEFKYRAYHDAGTICLDFEGEIASHRLVASVYDDGEIFEVLGYAAIRVPEGARRSIAETIVRANYGLRVGKFEMNYDDGELRFQLAHVLTDGVLEDTIIARSIATAIGMLDRYLPAILCVIYGNELPKDAVRSVEQPEVSETE